MEAVAELAGSQLALARAAVEALAPPEGRGAALPPATAALLGPALAALARLTRQLVAAVRRAAAALPLQRRLEDVQLGAVGASPTDAAAAGEDAEARGGSEAALARLGGLAAELLSLLSLPAAAPLMAGEVRLRGGWVRGKGGGREARGCRGRAAATRATGVHVRVAVLRTA
jgi:hypothetical protein